MARPSPAPVRGPVGCLPATIRARAACTWAGLSHSAHEPSHMYIPRNNLSHATRQLGSYTHTTSPQSRNRNCAENTTKCPGSASGLDATVHPHTGSHVPTQIAHKVSGWQRSTGARYTKQSRGAYHTSRDSSRDMCSCEIDDEHPLPNGLVNQASQASKVQSPNIHRGRGRPASRRRSCLEHRQ